MRKTDAALVATGAVLGAALLGSRFAPANLRDATWYTALDKPEFRPSPPLIGTAWTVLDVLLAYAGTKLLAAPASPARRVAAAGWAVSVTGLVAYPWLMFGRHRLGGALAAVLGMLTGTITTVAAATRVSPPASKALLPLIGWLCFAGVLQEEIWRRNR